MTIVDACLLVLVARSSPVVVLSSVAVLLLLVVLCDRGVGAARMLLTASLALRVVATLSSGVASWEGAASVVWNAGALWCAAALYRQPAANHFQSQPAVRQWTGRVLIFGAIGLPVLGGLLFGLGQSYLVSFEDASRDPRYAAFIGMRLRTTEPAVILGITTDVGKSGPLRVDYYTVTRSPGFSGPEVLSREQLPLGTEVRVLKVMRCTDCFLEFGERPHAIVEVASYRPAGTATIQVPLALISGRTPIFVGAESPVGRLVHVPPPKQVPEQ